MGNETESNTEMIPTKQNIGKENNIVVLIALRYVKRLKLPTHTHTPTQFVISRLSEVETPFGNWSCVTFLAGELDSESSHSHFHCCYFIEVIHVYSDNSQGAVIVVAAQVS